MPSRQMVNLGIECPDKYCLNICCSTLIASGNELSCLKINDTCSPEW
jgi:hypothetical protein